MDNSINVNGQSGTIGQNGVVNFAQPGLANVHFYIRSVHDPEGSRQRGRPWNKAVNYVRIQHPGEKDCIDRPVTDDDLAKQMWPRQWEAFEKKQEQAPDGTPVECLFPQNPEIAANLHGLGVHTVEQLSRLTAHGLQTIGIGAGQWQQKAKDFLSASTSGASLHRMQAENEKLRNSVETLSNQVSMLKGQLDAVLAEKDGVPKAMIPTFRPTVAQAQASVEHVTTGAEIDAAPLFDESEDEAPSDDDGVDPEPTADQPRRRGRPPRTIV